MRRSYLVFQGNDDPEGAVLKSFVAGATGVLGRALVPLLVARGDERWSTNLLRTEATDHLLAAGRAVNRTRMSSSGLSSGCSGCFGGVPVIE